MGESIYVYILARSHDIAINLFLHFPQEYCYDEAYKSWCILLSEQATIDQIGENIENFNYLLQMSY